MKKHRHILATILALSFLAATCVAADSSGEADAKSAPEAGAQKMRGRLEQLFIWRVSDKLHLTSEEEAKFTAEYKKLSGERTQASAKMDAILTKLSEEKTKKAKVKLLADYEDVFKKYTEIQQDEMTAMKKLFDTDRLASYVLLKRDMRHRFRDVLAKNGKEKDAPPANDEK